MSYEFCQVDKQEHLWTITLNRPERMNSLHPPANEELAGVFDAFASDDTAWVAIITGAGERAFCAGNDLRWQAEGNPITIPPSGFAGLTSRYDLTKPVIAAVNGVAMGGGFEIALACDIILAAETARFALPEPRVGLAALAGGLQRLPRQIPMKQAMGMILTGRTVLAPEGKALGFVTEVVPDADLMGKAKEWAEQIVTCSPMSIRASKQVAYESLAHPALKEANDNSKYKAVGAMMKSDDAVEGPKAFAEKRPPKWTGR